MKRILAHLGVHVINEHYLDNVTMATMIERMYGNTFYKLLYTFIYFC